MNTQRIRVQSYSLSDAKELHPLADRYFYGAIFLGVFVFFAITYPYRDISFPSPFLAMVGLVTVAGLTLASWLRPQYYWACIAFCVYIPFSGEYAGDFGGNMLGLNFTNILMVPIILQLLMQRNYLNTPWVRLHTPDLPLLCFCILSSVSLMRGAIEQGTPYATVMVIGLKRWLFPFLIYFVFVNLARSERGVKHLLMAICTVLTAIAILAMKESYDIGPRGTWDSMRVQGVLGQANSTGTFFVYYTLIFLGFFLCYWREKRYWLLLIPFLVCGRALTLANSRGGLIAFTVAFLATLWFRSKRLFLIGLTVVVVGSIYPQYLPETISGRLFTTIRPEPDGVDVDTPGEGSLADRLDKSARGRLAIWTAGIQMVEDKPLMGFGYGEFPRRIGSYDVLVAGRDPHNTYLGIAAEMGLVALFFFLLSLFLILRSCLRVYRHAPDRYMRSVGLAGTGMLLGVLCANFFGSRLDTTELTAYLWILSAIIVQYDTELRAKAAALRRSPRRLVVFPWIRDEEKVVV